MKKSNSQGESKFYAKAKKRSMTGSGPLKSNEKAQGYKVLASARELQELDMGAQSNLTDCKSMKEYE